LRRDLPEAFSRPYDQASGLSLDRVSANQGSEGRMRNEGIQRAGARDQELLSLLGTRIDLFLFFRLALTGLYGRARHH